VCVGELKWRVASMCEHRGIQGMERDGCPSPAQVGQNRLSSPSETQRVSGAVTFHLRSQSAGSFAQNAKEEADTIPVKTDSMK